MRIAFDVKGTIEGPEKFKVLKLLKTFQDLGHEVIVWSNSYHYALDAVKDNELNCVPHSKTTKWDVSSQDDFVDLAIDDDSEQTWLASKRFIWVRDLPAFDQIETFAKEVFNV